MSKTTAKSSMNTPAIFRKWEKKGREREVLHDDSEVFHKYASEF